LDKKKFSEQTITEKEDHYQVFLFLSLFFLCLERLVRLRRRPGKLPKNMSTTHKVAVLCLLTFSPFWFGFIETPKGLTDKGNEHYNEKRYQSAIEQYRKAQIKNPEDTRGF